MKRDDNDDSFGRQLREAGTALTPATSDPLHARVMSDVRQDRAAAAASSLAITGERASAGWRWIIGVAAAAVAVVVAVWVTRSREPRVQPMVHHEVPSLPPMPSIEKVVVKRVSPMRTKLHEARFAYLDRDSKRLARFLIRAVPGVPAQAKATIDHDATPSSASGT